MVLSNHNNQYQKTTKCEDIEGVCFSLSLSLYRQLYSSPYASAISSPFWGAGGEARSQKIPEMTISFVMSVSRSVH